MKYYLRGFLLAAVIAAGQTKPSFEVASIKPSNSADQRPVFNMRPEQFTVNNITVKRLIEVAYNVKSFQVSGGPGWAGSELYSINAKPPSPAKPDDVMPMLQSLLAERFQLVLRRETKEMPVYALVVAKNGTKLKDARETDPAIVGLKGRPDLPAVSGRPRISIVRRGRLTTQESDMAMLTSQLSGFLGRIVLDKTGLGGTYDIQLEWVPDENQVAMFQAMGVPEGFGAPAPDWKGPTLFTALEEQLGLRLDSQKGPVEMFTIERVEKPSDN